MNQWLQLAALLTALLAWCLYRVPTDVHQIEQDILRRATDTLEAAQVPLSPGALQADGRTIIITGPEGTPVVSEKSRLLVARLEGVKEVRLQVTAPPPPPPPPPPPADAVRLEEGLTKLFTAKPVKFEANQDSLSWTARQSLELAVPLLKQEPAVILNIYGSADNDKSPADLAGRRANAVKQYLISKGIVAERIIATGSQSSTARSTAELHAIPLPRTN